MVQDHARIFVVDLNERFPAETKSFDDGAREVLAENTRSIIFVMLMS